LTKGDLKRIVDFQLAYLAKRSSEQGITLEFTEGLKKAFAKEGYDPIYGARPLKRLIQRKVQNELALYILKGEVGDGDVVTVEVNKMGNAEFHKKGEAKRAVATP